MTDYCEWLEGREKRISGTYFSSFLGLFCIAYQYALMHRMKLQVTVDTISLYVTRADKKIPLIFVLDEITMEECPYVEEEQVNSWRKEALIQFYSEIITPLLQSAAQSAGLPNGQLWGQIATRMYNVHDRLLREADSEEERQTLLECLDLLRDEISAEVFGRTRNPFLIRFTWLDDPLKPGEKMRRKASCCQAYLRFDTCNYCYSCPKITKEQREEKRLEKIRKNS
ncbi:hypothetical protein [Brevibacillus daliensis]|uniref:hypothetical protein n=1 Tax=Brevibacillus daliensis TaxID=2892995 RepID=UPI001E5BC429|nr:hypothetical protein [Brevibacillus daliensis]